MSPTKTSAAGFFTEEDYGKSRELVLGRCPLPAKIDALTRESLLGLGCYLFEHGDRRFADWIHRIYQDIGASARPHVRGLWAQIPACIQSRFESVTSLGITSVERARLAVLLRELVCGWKSSEMERQQPGGMMHDHYCSDCGSECSEDFDDCVLGTITQCEECRAKELNGHRHTCKVCGRSWSCSSSCEDMQALTCGDCTDGLNDLEVAERFSSLWLMSALSTLGVGIGLLHMPYSYYSLLRFALCITACFGLAAAIPKDQKMWAGIFAAFAIVYNPLVPIHLHNKATWEAINIASLVAFWVGEYVFGHTKSKRSFAR